MFSQVMVVRLKCEVYGLSHLHFFLLFPLMVMIRATSSPHFMLTRMRLLPPCTPCSGPEKVPFPPLPIGAHGTLPLLVFCVLYLCPLSSPTHFTLRMEAARASETVSYHITAHHHNQEDQNLNVCFCLDVFSGINNAGRCIVHFCCCHYINFKLFVFSLSWHNFLLFSYMLLNNKLMYLDHKYKNVQSKAHPLIY